MAQGRLHRPSQATSRQHWVNNKIRSARVFYRKLEPWPRICPVFGNTGVGVTWSLELRLTLSALDVQSPVSLELDLTPRSSRLHEVTELRTAFPVRYPRRQPGHALSISP